MNSATVLEWKSPPPARSAEFLAMIRWAGSWLRGLTLTSAKRNGVTLRACVTFDGINVEGTYKEAYAKP